MESSIPIISVDRAVGHYTHLELDYAEMTEFYDQLPFEGKPSLGGCLVHFSALGHTRNKNLIMGSFARNPEDNRRYDPQSPPAHVLLLVGSCLRDRGQRDMINSALKHELVHYARQNIDDPTQSVSSEELILMREMRIRSKLSVKVALFGAKAVFSGLAVTLVTELADVSVDPETIALAAIGGSIALGAIDQGLRRRGSVAALRARLHELYKERPGEVAAHAYAETDHRLVIAADDSRKTRMYRKTQSTPLMNTMVDAGHRTMSLRPVKPEVQRIQGATL